MGGVTVDSSAGTVMGGASGIIALDSAGGAVSVTGNDLWMSSSLSWKTTMPDGYEQYSALMMFAFFYLMRNVFFGMGGGDDPKYFGARSDAECGKLTFMWTWLMMFRWPMTYQAAHGRQYLTFTATSTNRERTGNG